MTAKLTKAQRRVLERMATGDEVWTVTGRRPSVFWHDNLSDRSPTFPTMTALFKMGFVEDKSTRAFSGSEYVITPAGRAALEAKEGEPDANVPR